MKKIECTVNGKEYTFRTNNDGTNLFIGDSENRQISCECHLDGLKRMKRAIKGYFLQNEIPGKIKYIRCVGFTIP